jgi:hypothetical protein
LLPGAIRKLKWEGKIMKTQTFQWLSVAVIVVIGIVHLLMAPQEYGETPYMGILFGINFIAALIAALGIYRHETWGWLLGVAIAAGSLIGYVLSRTVGLPGIEIEEWLQPVGILSVAVEVIFILAAFVKKPWIDIAQRAS